ncbi:MAG: hypothetical protein D8M59_10730 [Planctomycetes bacterium]|nr:hypothetical protein [Planctomycetota bacterium]NOG54175.1 hypothetical protein [Planctomycetota bacterium]
MATGTDHYTLQVEISLYFIPPMTEAGRGIGLLQHFRLPFVPVHGMILTGGAFNTSPSPEGYMLRDVTWDVDREMFLATSSLHMYGEPLGLVPEEIAEWYARGWRLGHNVDWYEEATPEPDEVIEDEGCTEDDIVRDDIEVMHTWERRRRPRDYNLGFRALIRTMAESYNNLSVAYAMKETGRCLSEDHSLKAAPEKAQRQWNEAIEAYLSMTWDEQDKWRCRICRTYPRLDTLAKAMARGQ